MNTKKPKRTAIKIISSVLIIILVISGITVFSQYAKYGYYKVSDKFFQSLDDSEAKTICHVMTLSERMQANLIVGDIINALNYSGSRADCDIAEPLTRFCRFTDVYDYSTVQSNVTLITYKRTKDTGYLWIKYSYENRDENDILVTGAWNILCLVKVKETADGYEIIDIREGP